MKEENGKHQVHPDVGKIVPQATGSGKKCKYCDMPMPRLARVCIHCHRDQRWYLNYFRRGDLLVIIFILLSVALVYLSHENLRESREERVKAGEALQRAPSAEDIVKRAQQELEKLRQSGEEGRKEVDRITSLVKEAEGKLSAVETLAKEARQKADRSQYLDIALYNVIGNKSAKVAAIPLVATPINDWSELFVIRNKGKIGFDCSPEAVDACKAVIEKMPLYPFSYYFLAKCFKEQKNPLWREYALKAQRILKETTAFPSHHGDHDLALKEIGELLKE
jgi:transcriptional antiterminator Rof (Rho-off)